MVNAYLAVAALFASVCSVKGQIEISYPGVGKPESPGGWLIYWTGGTPPYIAAMMDYNDPSTIYNVTTTTDTTFKFQVTTPAGTNIKYHVEDADGTIQEVGPFVVVDVVKTTYPGTPAVGVDNKFTWANGIAPYKLTVYGSDSVTVLHTSPDIDGADSSYIWDFSGAGLSKGDTVYFQMCDSQQECTQSKAVYLSDSSAVSQSQQTASSRTQAIGTSTATHGSSSHSGGGSHKAPIGAIVGGVVGGIVFLGAIAGLAAFLIFRKRAARARLAASAANVNPVTYSNDSGESGLGKDGGSAIISPYSPQMSQTAAPLPASASAVPTTASMTTGGMYTSPSSPAPMTAEYTGSNLGHGYTAASPQAMTYYSPQSSQRQSMQLAPLQPGSPAPTSPNFQLQQQTGGAPSALPAGMHFNYTGVPEVQ